MTALVIALILVLCAAVAIGYMKWIKAVESKEELEKLKDTAAYVQSLTTILALFVAGGWAAYTWITQWNDRGAALQETVFAEQTFPPGTSTEDGFFIQGHVGIKNVGTKTTYVKLADGPLFVARMKAESIPRLMLNRNEDVGVNCQDAKVGLDTPTRFLLARPVVEGRQDVELGDEIRAGAEDVFNFVVKVDKPGVYAVMFSAEVPPEEEASVTVKGPHDWGPCENKQLREQFRWESPAYFVAVKALVKDSRPGMGSRSQGTGDREGKKKNVSALKQ